MVNLERFRQRLRDTEREFLAEVARLEGEARIGGDGEVRDHTDDAAISESRSESLQEVMMVSNTLAQVQDALRRMENGTYGKCTVCGRAIEIARLEAVPWTPYCLEDQQKQDQADDAPQHGSTL
jgi:DnaK suppressor protein